LRNFNLVVLFATSLRGWNCNCLW